jgi:hypothetical protein
MAAHKRDSQKGHDRKKTDGTSETQPTAQTHTEGSAHEHTNPQLTETGHEMGDTGSRFGAGGKSSVSKSTSKSDR